MKRSSSAPGAQQPGRVFKFSSVMVALFAVLLFVPALVYGPPEDYDDDNIGYVLRSYRLLGSPWWDAVLTVRLRPAPACRLLTPQPRQSLLVSFSVYATGFDAVDKNVDGWLAVVLAAESFVGCGHRGEAVSAPASLSPVLRSRLVFFGLFVVSFSRKVLRY